MESARAKSTVILSVGFLCPRSMELKYVTCILALWASSSKDHFLALRKLRTRIPSLTLARLAMRLAGLFLAIFLTPIVTCLGETIKSHHRLEVNFRIDTTQNLISSKCMSESCIQKIPAGGAERAALQKKGQFWTPAWLAEIMATWTTEHSPPTLFDPAVGPGTFFSAARSIGFRGGFAGFELHPNVFAECDKKRLNESDFRRVRHADFISASTGHQYPAIISNPPYIRHHRLSLGEKQRLRSLSEKCLGFILDGRTGLHVYFLMKCLEMLAPNGKLAFLLPADVCESVSSNRFWKRICERFRLDAIITFEESAAPFPQVDTNVMVFLVSNRTPTQSFPWLRLQHRDRELTLEALRCPEKHAGICQTREISEALSTGFSRPPRHNIDGLPLSSFARIVRGIATGANEFFFLTKKQIITLGLDEHFFVRAIGRTRDCPDSVVTEELLEQLELKDRPTWLLKLGNEQKEQYPEPLRNYLNFGEREGFNNRSLIGTRRPWYRMEHRSPPPILFAYLGRRDCRFIANRARVLPLTGFLCVYPFDESADAVGRLLLAINHADTIANLHFAAKSYGSGALKAEPRQLDQLLIPRHIVKKYCLGEPVLPASRKVERSRSRKKVALDQPCFQL